VPDLGVIKVLPTQSGIVTSKSVVEGQIVSRGDVLYLISSERRSSEFGETQALLSEHARARVESIRRDIEQTRRIASADTAAAREKLAGLRREQQKVGELRTDLEQRLRIARRKQQRYSELREQGFISQDQLVTAEVEVLDQKNKLDNLEREALSLAWQVKEQESEVQNLPARYDAQISEYGRAMSEAEEKLTQSETARQWIVIAPESGVATAVVGEVGQAVDSGRPLLAIVPRGAKLQARLFAASSAVGFVKAGDDVHLRLASFPYQKFGHQHGRVATVSLVSSSTSDFLGERAASEFGEPVYQIVVDLDSQSVLAYGERRPLQAGMSVEADVMQETRRLYEWVLEPLYSLEGRVTRGTGG
jgi:membrane fusion protein